LFPQSIFAQADPRCWEQKACIQQRKSNDLLNTLSTDEINKGFIQTDETAVACGGKVDGAQQSIGFCSPATNAETKINFGEKNSFNNLGEFIAHMYQYSIIAAALLSAVMLIIAGFIWTTSGGNPERITSAKRKIAGSITGLLLAVLSYTLLNVINPNLINIRLPQVWMINEAGLTPPWCKDIPEPNTKLALVGLSNLSASAKDAKKKALNAQTPYLLGLPQATCGYDYFVQGTNGLSCTGDICPADKPICFKSLQNDNPWCYNARIMGSITNSRLQDNMVANAGNWFFSTGLDIISYFWAWSDNEGWVEEIHIGTVCKKDGEVQREIKGKDAPYKSHNGKDIYTQEYSFQYTDAKIEELANTACDTPENFRGFVIIADMNISNSSKKEGHVLGVLGENSFIDMCDQPIGRLSCTGEDSDGDFCEQHCAFILGPHASPGIEQESFITKDLLLKGFRFNIDVGAINVVENEPERRKNFYEKYGIYKFVPKPEDLREAEDYGYMIL